MTHQRPLAIRVRYWMHTDVHWLYECVIECTPTSIFVIHMQWNVQH